MQVPRPQPEVISALDPAAVQAQLTAALKASHDVADPTLARLASATTTLRLNRQVSTAPGLNPFRTALAYSALSSAAIQGHIARLQAGETSPSLLQAIAYDAFSWPILVDEMGHGWDQVRANAGQALGAAAGQVDEWTRQAGDNQAQVLQALINAIGQERLRNLVYSVWGPIGMNRY